MNYAGESVRWGEINLCKFAIHACNPKSCILRGFSWRIKNCSRDTPITPSHAFIVFILCARPLDSSNQPAEELGILESSSQPWKPTGRTNNMSSRWWFERFLTFIHMWGNDPN